MIEILILYAVRNRERTLYGIRKDIIDIFGMFTKPSIGTIYPALRRLIKEEALSVFEKISEGGKKFCYFSITKKGLDIFRKYFFNTKKENPSLFYVHLQARLGVMGLLKKEDKKLFIEDSLKKVDIYSFEINNRINDDFLELDYYQRKLLNKMLEDLNSLKMYIESLKIENVL